MSILLSLYTKDGIVFAADRNLTLSEAGVQVVVEGYKTKVLMWPNHRAIVGFVGLAELEHLEMDEWLRIFIAETRNFTTLTDVANLLIQRLNEAYSRLHVPTPKPPLIIHLGGFEAISNVQTPMLHVVTNVPGLTDEGGYQPTREQFEASEQVRPQFESWPSPNKYPKEVRQRLAEMEERDHFLWFNNGDKYAAFNVLKGALYAALAYVHHNLESSAPTTRSLFDWQAYAKIAVELHGLYYRHTLPGDQRYVGGGVDMCSIPWPE